MPYHKSQRFEDPDFYQAKQEIKKRFNKILTDLQKTVERNGYAVQTIQRFRGCLEHPENNDVTRLPFYSDIPRSHKYNKINCILCLISYSIQLYWRFCNKIPIIEEMLTRFLNRLENYAAKELESFEIKGKQYPDGYYLEEIE